MSHALTTWRRQTPKVIKFSTTSSNSTIRWLTSAVKLSLRRKEVRLHLKASRKIKSNRRNSLRSLKMRLNDLSKCSTSLNRAKEKRLKNATRKRERLEILNFSYKSRAKLPTVGKLTFNQQGKSKDSSNLVSRLSRCWPNLERVFSELRREFWPLNSWRIQFLICMLKKWSSTRSVRTHERQKKRWSSICTHTWTRSMD